MYMCDALCWARCFGRVRTPVRNDVESQAATYQTNPLVLLSYDKDVEYSIVSKPRLAPRLALSTTRLALTDKLYTCSV